MTDSSPAAPPAVSPLAWLDAALEGARAYLLLACLVIAAAAPGVVAMAPLDRDESRFAQATTQMLETGDFVRISFQDEPRHKKPVGIHWLQAPVVALVGADEARAIAAYRLPSLAGALLATFALFVVGTTIATRRAAFTGAAALGLTVLLSTEAGIAKTDAMLCGLVAAAFAGLALLRAGRSSAGAYAFWAALGAAILVKGPIGPLVLGLALVTLAVWERRVGWMARLLAPGAIALGLAIALPWMIAIGVATDGAFFREAIAQDLAPKLAGGHEDHGGPPGYHLALLPLLSWPGALLLPAAALAAWRGRADPAMRFLIAWAVPGWLMFEIAPTKLVHYALPVYGAILLAGAIGLDRGLGRSGAARAWAAGLFLLGAGLLVALLIALPLQFRGDVAAGAAAAAAIGIVSLAVAWAVARDRWGKALAAAAVAGVAFSAAAKGVVIPSAADLDVSRQVAAALERHGLHPLRSPGRPGPLVGAGYSEPSLVFLTRTDSMLTTPERAAASAGAGAGAVVGAAERAAFDAGLAARGLRAREEARVTGLNYSKGDPVALSILRIEPADARS